MKSMWYLFTMHDVVHDGFDTRAIFCQEGFEWVGGKGPPVPVYPQDTCEDKKETNP